MHFHTVCAALTAVALVSLESHAQPMPMPVQQQLFFGATCGGLPFNKRFAVCCEHEVIPVSPSALSFTSCCGPEPFDNRTHGCCAGDMYERVSELCCAATVTTDGGAATHVCCGDNTYRKNEPKMCCAGNVVNAMRGREKCCGHESIVIGIEGCCNGMKYDLSIGICCGGYLQSFPGGHYSWLCCGDHVIPRNSPEVACCAGVKRYQPEIEVCCGKQVAQKKGPLKCCANRRFDSRHRSCCDGKVVRSECPTEPVVDTAAAQGVEKPPPTPSTHHDARSRVKTEPEPSSAPPSQPRSRAQTLAQLTTEPPKPRTTKPPAPRVPARLPFSLPDFYKLPPFWQRYIRERMRMVPV